MNQEELIFKFKVKGIKEYLWQFKLYIQGVPRNMRVARRLKSRVKTLNLFVTLSRQPTFTFMILETINNNHKIILVLTFLKCSLPFLCCQYYRRYEEFCKDILVLFDASLIN